MSSTGDVDETDETLENVDVSPVKGNACVKRGNHNYHINLYKIIITLIRK